MKFVQSCFGKLMFAMFLIGCFCAVDVEAGRTFAQRIAIDSNGAGVAVWNQDMGGFNIVQAATMTMTGTWSGPVTLSPGTEDSSYPRLVVDATSDAVVIWSTFDSGLGVRVLKASALFLGSWTPATIISSTIPASLEDVAIFQSNLSDAAYRLAIDPTSAATGDAVALWEATIGGNLVVRSARYSKASQTWSLPVTVGP